MKSFVVLFFIALSCSSHAQLPREDFGSQFAQPLWVVPQLEREFFMFPDHANYYIPIPDSTFYKEGQLYKVTTQVENEASIKLMENDPKIQELQSSILALNLDSIVFESFQPTEEKAEILYIRRFGSDVPCCTPPIHYDEWYIFNDSVKISLLAVDTLVKNNLSKQWYVHGNYFIITYRQHYIGNNSYDYTRTIYFRKPE